MFTGLIEALAEVAEVCEEPPGRRLTVRAPGIADGANIGDSIAVNGCCLTVVGNQDQKLAFQAGPETLACTNLGQISVGLRVNLERAAKIGDPLGGHYVTGHVDGVGRLVERTDEGEWSTCWFSADPSLTRQMAPKGSVAVDGVSLTLVKVETERFSVALIPHTLAETTLGALREGDPVHLETDLLAKYVERQLVAREEG